MKYRTCMLRLCGRNEQLVANPVIQVGRDAGSSPVIVEAYSYFLNKTKGEMK